MTGDNPADILESASPTDENIIKIYEICVEMADRVSERRQSANNFYLSVTTALISIPFFLQSLNSQENSRILISLAGIAICFLWRRNIESYKSLNTGKFFVIKDLEKKLPYKAFETEWEFLRRGQFGGKSSKHYEFSAVEKYVPFVFGSMFLCTLFDVNLDGAINYVIDLII